MSEVLPSANGQFSPSHQLAPRFPNSSTSLIYLFTSASIPSRHYLLMNHETGIITHSLTPHSSVYYHRPFVIAFVPIASLPVHITSFSIILSLYDPPSLLYNPLLFCTTAPFPPSLYNPPLSLYDCPRRYTRRSCSMTGNRIRRMYVLWSHLY